MRSGAGGVDRVGAAPLEQENVPVPAAPSPPRTTPRPAAPGPLAGARVLAGLARFARRLGRLGQPGRLWPVRWFDAHPWVWSLLGAVVFLAAAWHVVSSFL